jgi:hypothetical protein
MTGGGFGGCTVTLVERSAVKALEKALQSRYRKDLNLKCECYECLPDDGTGVLDLASYSGAASEHKGSKPHEDKMGCEARECKVWEKFGNPNPALIALAVFAVAVGTAMLVRKFK